LPGRLKVKKLTAACFKPLSSPVVASSAEAAHSASSSPPLIHSPPLQTSLKPDFMHLFRSIRELSEYLASFCQAALARILLFSWKRQPLPGFRQPGAMISETGLKFFTTPSNDYSHTE
jgi:hypothetical protein